MIKVLVKVNENNVITEITSDIFNKEEGYVIIDAGEGDMYAHAQNAYLDKGILDNAGKYNYKLVDGKPELITDEEKAVLFPESESPKSESELDIIKEQLELTTQTLNFVMSML